MEVQIINQIIEGDCQEKGGRAETSVISCRQLKKLSFPGCSKRARRKAPEILRSEAYLAVRRSDEG